MIFVCVKWSKRKFSNYTNNKNKNGIHTATFYKYKNKMISYKAYKRLILLNEDAYVVKHVCYKYNINENYCIFLLFTSKEITYFPGIETPIENIKLNNSIFKYVNPLILCKNEIFLNYLTLSTEWNTFPTYVKTNSINKVVKDVLNGVKISYRDSHDYFSNDMLIVKNDNDMLTYLKVPHPNFYWKSNIWYNKLFTPFHNNLIASSKYEINLDQIRRFDKIVNSNNSPELEVYYVREIKGYTGSENFVNIENINFKWTDI